MGVIWFWFDLVFCFNFSCVLICLLYCVFVGIVWVLWFSDFVFSYWFVV